MKPASVFEETYNYYLEQISRINLEERARTLGAYYEQGHLEIAMFDNHYQVGPDGVFQRPGHKPNFAIRVVLARYVLQCPASPPPEGDWVTYREFKDASPLLGYFTANTNKIIESTYGGNLAGLEAACRRLGGENYLLGPDCDLAVRFCALPRIPIGLTFNDQDESFPAQATVLFRQSAEAYLDMECLCILGTLLAGRLVAEAGVEVNL